MADEWDGELRLIVRNLGDTINVYVQLNDRLVRNVNAYYGLLDVNEPTLLFTLDLDKNIAGVFLLIAHFSGEIYAQKYDNIKSIWFDLPPDDFEPPTDHSSALAFLKTHLPGGFVQDPAYGLGFKAVSLQCRSKSVGIGIHELPPGGPSFRPHPHRSVLSENQQTVPLDESN